jgi:putative oxidoreductase
VRRLFSSFARGWPGVGLLLLRLVTGVALIHRGVNLLWSSPPVHLAVLCAVVIAAGLLLVIGLWTPVAGTLTAGVEAWKMFSHSADPLTHILLGTLGAALALIGPGAWSIDASLFGWKRLDIRPPKGSADQSI